MTEWNLATSKEHFEQALAFAKKRYDVLVGTGTTPAHAIEPAIHHAIARSGPRLKDREKGTIMGLIRAELKKIPPPART